MVNTGNKIVPSPKPEKKVNREAIKAVNGIIKNDISCDI